MTIGRRKGIMGKIIERKKTGRPNENARRKVFLHS